MRQLKKLATALLCVLLLGGCGVNPLNAAGYMEGLLDETYKGTWDVSYLQLVNISSSQLQASYRAGLEAEYERFADYFRLEDSISDETKAAFIDWLGGLYANARYEVTHATRSGSGAWLVEVSVQPIRTVAGLADRVAIWQYGFEATTNAVSTLERREAWAQMVLEKCRAAELEYGEAVTIAVRLVADEEGYYSIGTQDFYNLDALVLPYEN